VSEQSLVPGFEPGYWDAMRQTARESLTFSWGWETTNPGTAVIKATIPSYRVPVGLLWLSSVDDRTLFIENCYVLECLRRCGVMTRMHAYMLEIYPQIQRVQTGQSFLDGREWLRANGYTRKRNGDWVYYRPDRSEAA